MEAAEIKNLLEAQGKAFEEFKSANDARVKAIEEKGWAPADLEQKVAAANDEITKLGKAIDELSKKANRPPAPGEDKDALATEHKAALNKFLRKGDTNGLTDIEKKAITTYYDPGNAFFLTEEMESSIVRLADQIAVFPTLAQTINGSAAVYKKRVQTSGATYLWRGEGENPDKTDTPKFQLMRFDTREVDAYPEVTNESLEDLGFNVEGFLVDEVSRAFAKAEAEAFLLGNGETKPKGLLTYSTVANANWAWGTIGYVASGKAGAFADTAPSDKLIDLIHSLKRQYRTGASFLLNDLTLAAIRKFKDGQGNYLWQPGLIAGQTSTLLGYPVQSDDYMPDIAADKLAIAFGDFKTTYLIYRRRGMVLIRDNITNKGFTSFWITKRVGGGVQNFEAVKFMKFAAN